jgi:hypothetical protein
MKIFVFSDTHGDTSGMELVLSKATPDMIIHCGDGIHDALQIQRKYPDIKVHTVRGNCDDYNTGEAEQFLQIMGNTLFFTHGDNYNVHDKSLTVSQPESEIVKHAKKHSANIVLHGHTHLATFTFDDGIYLLNPGCASVTKPYFFKPSFGCIEIFENKIICKLLSVEVFEKL